jgi:RND family efflux transporter MFP subunit
MAELNTQIILAKTTYDRQKRLWEQKIGSEMQYLQTKTQYESLENNVNTLKDQANKMKLIAPFSGVVDEIFPKKGELTNPQTQVVRLVNLDEVYVEADVTETYLPYIKIGNETLIRFPSINKEIISTVAQVGNVINPNNRSFKTKINIPNKDNDLKPNLLADIKIVDLETNGIVIPSNLIQKDHIGDSYVYTVSNKNSEYLITKKLVKIANEYDHNSLIEDGLSANDTLVDKGARFVRNGEIVRIAN